MVTQFLRQIFSGQLQLCDQVIILPTGGIADVQPTGGLIFDDESNPQIAGFSHCL